MNLPRGFGRGRTVSAYLIGAVAVLSLVLAGILWVIWAREAGAADWGFGLAAGATLMTVLAGVAGFCRWVDKPGQKTALAEAGSGFRLPDLVARRHAERIGRIGSWYWILATDEVVWSDEAFRILGLKNGEVIPGWFEFLKFVHHEDRDAVQDWFRTAWKNDTETTCECRILKADGAVIWGEARLGPLFEDGIKTAVFGTLMDVTDRVERLREIEALNADQERLVETRTAELQDEIAERKHAEDEARQNADRLRESEKNLNQLLDMSPVGITIVSEETHDRLYANAAMAEMFGISRETPLDEWGARWTFADPSGAELMFRQVFRDGGLSNLELRRKRPDGSTWWCLHNSRPIVFAGQPAAIVWHLDITNRKNFEAELSRTEEQLRSTINNAPAGILLTDKEMNIVVANDVLRDIIKVPEEMMAAGRNYADVIRFLANRGDYGRNPDRTVDEILDALKTPAERSLEYTSLDGKVFNVRRHPVGAGGAVTIAMDVSELKEAEERLRQALWDLELAQDELVHSEKMASLGSLVAGVAHEINTPMGTALTAATHVREETLKVTAALKKNEIKRSQFENFLLTADEGSKIIEVNLTRAAHLIRSFKQVAVDQSSEQRRPFNVDSYLRETIESLTPQLRSYPKIELVLDADADVVIDSFPGAFSQILSNLLLNALTHAFGQEGEGKIEIRTLTFGDQVRISFADNGLGMTEAVRGRIFEPFFTTRRGAGGSGLGLHIVYNLVTTKLSGTIRCFSNPGEGTRFDITLPITSETVDD
ncbi:PAS domain S-box protein [Nisaea sp.]|uniref:PAS domain S-box protein n=1 Tax=Nisaea sp. TaxID=2024842 RepID=UPI0032F03819